MSARRVRAVGERAFLVECAGLTEVLGLQAALAAEPPPGLVESLPAARTLLVTATDRRARDRLTALLRELPAGSTRATGGDVVTIDTVYDGEDLAAVASLTGLSEEGVIAAHTGQLWTAAFGGFAPGFAYLVGEDGALEVPRHATPRTTVPQGAVALAGRFSAVYPRPSPGGWQLIGRTAAPMWDLDRDPPALLRPGHRVRFRAMRELVTARPTATGDAAGGDPSHHAPASSPPSTRREPSCPAQRSSPSAPSTRRELSSSARRSAPSAPSGRRELDRSPRDPALGAHREAGLAQADVPDSSRGLTVVAPGVQSLVEDLGRPGRLDLGVSRSGAADRGSARQANRLVGNERDAAVVEAVLGGLELQAQGHQVLAVCGARVPLTVTDGDGAETARPPTDAPFLLPDGHVLRLGQPDSGFRAYVAVRGGVAVPPVLGSRSTDLLSGIGPSPLAVGTLLPVGPAPGAAVGGPEPAREVPTGPVVDVEVVLGPRADWVTEESRDRLLDQEWTVSERSNRVGLRLEGAPLERATEEELASEGTVAGAVQLPADGRPVVFLADHPVTGGYPVLAVVVDEDLDLLAQLRPGTRLRFRAQG